MPKCNPRQIFFYINIEKCRFPRNADIFLFQHLHLFILSFLILLDTNPFKHRYCCIQTFLHTDIFTQSTQKLLSRRFYIDLFKQTFLYICFYPQIFYKQIFFQIIIFTQIFLYTNTFTHKRFFTQTLFIHRSFVYTEKIAILSQFLAIDPYFVGKGCNGSPKCQFQINF